MDIGERIKQRREQINMTLKEVAERLNVSEATVQRYESGNIKNLKQSTISELSVILNVDPCWIMGWKAKTNSNVQERNLSNIEILYNSLDDMDKVRAESYIEGLLSSDKYMEHKDSYKKLMPDPIQTRSR